jgi:hypothetical protein
MHSGRVWHQLETLKMPSRDIALLYYETMTKKRGTERFASDEIFFLEWGKNVLNPIMNHHLNRPLETPTFGKMMMHLLKQEIYRFEYKFKMQHHRPDHPDYRKPER